MKNTTEKSTDKKSYSKIVKSNDHKLKIVKTDKIPDYSDTELKSLNYYIKECKQKISFLTLVNKVATSLRQYSCKTIADAKEKANLIYDEPIIDHCLPQLNKINVKIDNSIIKNPTKEELSEYRQRLVNYQHKLQKNKKNTIKIPSTITAYITSNIDTIHDEILTEYYLDEQIRNNTRQLLNDEQLNNYYSDVLKENNTELNKYLEFLKVLETIKKDINEILKDKTKLLPTPRMLPIVSQGKEKNISLGNYYTMAKRKLDIEDLTLALRKFAPNIYNEKLTKCTQQELEDFILDNSQEIITYIDGAKLTILEDRAFCALRYLAVEAVDKGLVTTPDSEVTVIPADIYKLTGIPYTKKNGYHTEQRLAIKDAITNNEGNLRKAIHIEVPQNHKDGYAISSTNFITRVNWNDEKNQVIYRIESLFF